MHTPGILQDIPVTGRDHFENELAEEAIWALQSATPCAFCFRSLGGFTSTPRKCPEEQRSRASLNPTMYPSSYDMKMAAQGFHKLHKPKLTNSRMGTWPWQI